MELCFKPIKDRSKFADIANKKCYRLKDHQGPCEEYPYLKHLKQDYHLIANKIQRDSTKTTGAAWSSTEAGPNRMDRWGMLLTDEQLLEYGIDMSRLQPQVVSKLREKAAPYGDCMEVAAKLTWMVYQMMNAPEPPADIKEYLEGRFGVMKPSSTKCLICRDILDFNLFALARRGKAELETAHRSPRLHNIENVGFAHRECNIAQGNKDLEQFYKWIAEILKRVTENGYNSES